MTVGATASTSAAEVSGAMNESTTSPVGSVIVPALSSIAGPGIVIPLVSSSPSTISYWNRRAVVLFPPLKVACRTVPPILIPI